MTDFRRPSNPEPFTEELLKADRSPMTEEEHTFLAAVTGEARVFVRRMGRRTRRTSRGRAAGELQDLAESIDQARRALLRAQAAERKAQT